MALDKQFLKYKLEKIKNDRIWKDQDAESKRRSRKENAKLAQEEADAIHSYLTGEDPIDMFDNKSYLENRLPGNLYLTDKGQLNIIPSQDDPKIKKTKLQRLLRKHKTVANANFDFGKRLKIFRKIFDKLNITLSKDEVKIEGNLRVGSLDFLDGTKGLNTEFIVAAGVIGGVATYKKITVRNGLIVKVEPTVIPI